MFKISDLIIDGPQKGKTFIFAHGAGAPMDSDWMNILVEKLVARNIRVVRFEFPYMKEVRLQGKKRPPNSAKILRESWHEVIDLFKEVKDLYIGGKSMGGRMASLVADEVKVKGLILLGFPFHAPGKDVGDRIHHLETLKKKTVIFQGDRDVMGNYNDVKKYKLSKKIKVTWLEDGDHSFKPRKKTGHTLEDHLERVAEGICTFIRP
jgi:predicted alpha/beta-hydrolase family hydrolase